MPSLRGCVTSGPSEKAVISATSPAFVVNSSKWPEKNHSMRSGPSDSEPGTLARRTASHHVVEGCRIGRFVR